MAQDSVLRDKAMKILSLNRFCRCLLLILWSLTIGSTGCGGAQGSYNGRSSSYWRSALSNSNPEAIGDAAWALGQIGATGADSEKSVTALVRLADYSSMLVRYRVFEALQKIGPQSVPAVIPLLDHSDSDVRKRTAALLKEVVPKQDAISQALINSLRNKDEGVRESILDALGSSGTKAKAALAIVIDLSERDPDSGVRQRATWAIGQVGQSEPDALISLSRHLHDSDAEVRKMAVWGLSALGAEAFGAMSEAARSEDLVVRTTSLGYLPNLIRGRDSTPASKANAIQILSDTLSDRNDDVRNSAVHAIFTTGPEANALSTKLYDLLEKERNENIRGLVLVALGSVGSVIPERVSVSLADKSYSVRQATVRLLSDVNPIPVLLWRRALKNPYSDVRSPAAYLLGRAGSRDAIPELTACSKDKDKSVRAACNQAIEEITNR